MRFILALAFLAFLLVLVVIGFHQVPGVSAGGGFSDNFLFSTFLETLSFLVTVAVIGPLTAEFVERRHEREWKTARGNARDRLNASLALFADAYREFLTPNPSPDLPDHQWITRRGALDRTILSIRRFFDDYEDEHPAFNPRMHSAASKVRRDLKTLMDFYSSAQDHVQDSEPRRVYIDADDIRKLRMMIAGQGPRRGETEGAAHQDGFASTGIDDPYFDTYGELFIDYSDNLSFRRSSLGLEGFPEISLETMANNWAEFLANTPADGRPQNPIGESLTALAATQRESFVSYLKIWRDRRTTREKTIIDHMVVKYQRPSAGRAGG